jgi:hypothetical protein
VNEAPGRLAEDFGPFFSLVSTARRPARGRIFARLRIWFIRRI